MRKLNTEKKNWDLSKLFASDDDPKILENRKLVEEKSYQFINKWKERDDYMNDAKILKEALDEYEAWLKDFGPNMKEGYYFWLMEQVNGDDPKIKAGVSKADEFGKKIINDITFFDLKLGKIDEKKQEEFLKDEDLKDYRHFLEKTFAGAKHMLSEKEEKILTLKSGPARENWERMVERFISREEREIDVADGKKELKNFSEILGLISDKEKNVRDSAAEALNDILKKNSDIAESEINSILENKKIDDELRGFPRPDSSRHLSDDVDEDVVDALIKAVSEGFDISKKYYELKAKLMGVEKIKYHERTVSYGNINKNYSYDESVALVYKVFSDIDQEFADIFAGFVEEGRIDVDPKKGKRSGAFCAYTLLSQPTYMMLNHTGKLRDVLTMAHEAGHGIHFEMTRKKQNALNFGTPMSTAEVASTFMEDFVLEELLKEADDELKLAILMNKLDDSVSTIQRQIACYVFEQELHKEFREKGHLSKDDIGKIFQERMHAYMGNAVEMSPGSENWWVYWNHIRSFFYVYSYASGLLISKAMQNAFRGDRKFIVKLKEFFSSGMHDSPKDIFENLGIDITKKEFWKNGLLEMESLLKETEALAKKLGKI